MVNPWWPVKGLKNVQVSLNITTLSLIVESAADTVMSAVMCVIIDGKVSVMTMTESNDVVKASRSKPYRPLASSWPHLRCDVGLEEGE